MPTLEELRPEYEQLFNTCIINSRNFAAIDRIAVSITGSKTTYEAVGKPLNIPWYFIGIIHAMECNLDFKKHLHNGDPLTARTVHVPRGLPKNGNPPFSFKESATDALLYEGFDKVNDWSIAGMLFLFEKYNGFGYRRNSIKIPSPYLWSFSNHYTKGKFSADGVYDPELVSKQAGTATILRRLAEMQVITFSDQQLNRVRLIRELGETVRYAPNIVNEDARRLQVLLNEAGFPLLRDGKAGERTSNAYKQLTGKYLPGDARRK